MKHLSILLILAVCLVSSSCIPLKDQVYYQNKSGSLDSISRVIEQSKPYRVQINDILNIRIKVLDQENVEIFNPIGEKNLNAESAERAYFDGFTVDLGGNIRIPELGELNVLGFTTKEIGEEIENKLLEDQFKETANIFVTVKLAGLRYTTSGEMGSTGTQVVFTDRLNIYEAIANAGEIKITGDRKDVMIIRQYPHGQQIHHIDLTNINAMYSPYYYIQPNDMIYVKPLKQKVWGTGVTGQQTFTSIVAITTFITTTILLIDRL
ncbi:polysaccharide biosynthesis/export family protein [Ichthyenterobacterium sp. W332]|uniref:Polysaccharide biosynthesis/export family protein n=1 Tax=Microcosmobacter mediterraneus TaxID=3075607 RepID=A0ABU2YGN1_9FLAO|nr:polysaccharide biosynthesis/export family protein [Ichthyenterobacterium sp. W332]MDT0557333.1 polysaccharide biosynthesis/export family protein [Ichthyenterobacterium sp. W332]